MKFEPRLKEKRWSVENEHSLIEKWEKDGILEFDFDSDKPIFSIDTPPPYASGSWHVGAAAHYCQFDMFARYYRLKGYRVYFPMGIDRNGLPIEIKVEQEYGIKAREVDREYFINLCKARLDEYEKGILDIIRRLGMIARYWDPYRTDSIEYRAFTQETFIEMWKKGLIYEADRPSIWCPACHTTIAEAEVEYESKNGKLYYVKFQLEDGGYIVVATTRPELIGATAAVLYHPDDERYKHLEGKRAILPIFNEPVPILPYSTVDPEYGSGLMMLSSFGDLTDVRLFRELGFSFRVLINKEGLMNEKAGKYAGLSVDEARLAIVKDLKTSNLIEKIEEVTQNIPICWRSKNPVEFIVTKDLYLKQIAFREDLKKLADEITFLPSFHKNVLINWINSISIDWAITRTRYYGTEVPIWYCKKCGFPHVPEPGKYYRPWRDPAPFDKCERCGEKEFIGDNRTFDTWIDSSVSALYISKYNRDMDFFEKCFPISVRPQGIDIVRTWLHYSLLRIYLLTNRPAFKYIRLSGMGLDSRGRAMHKSLGNIVLPTPIFNKYGADAFRIWAASETKLGFNYRYSEAKIRAARNFLTKIWNIARFVSMFPYIQEFDLNDLTPLDKQIIFEVDNLIKKAEEEYSTLDFFQTINYLKFFIWNIYASHYIELVKNRAYNQSKIFSIEEQRSAWYTLHYTLRIILLILHPVAPFITDYIWRKLYDDKGILFMSFPEISGISVEPKFKLLMQFNSLIWKAKEEKGISLKEDVSKVITSYILEEFSLDIKETHNIGVLEFRDDLTVDDTQIFFSR